VGRDWIPGVLVTVQRGPHAGKSGVLESILNPVRQIAIKKCAQSDDVYRVVHLMCVSTIVAD
jgi:hypothetical protein